jgi:xanthine dehydrogenase YagS FAD-binding subunit
MTPFRFTRATDVRSAIAAVAGDVNAQFIAGGTSQVDLLKEGVQHPGHLIDISHLPMREIEPLTAGGLRIGANVTNAALARHPEVRGAYAAISEAVLAGASHQIRNVATTAGNLLQRTRCPYLRHPDQPCNKRDPGTGCAAVIGYSRLHAVFGATDDGPQSPNTCIAVHPSDLAVALAAHEAVIVTEGPDGSRRIPFSDLLRLPGEQPDVDSNLQHGELITAVELPGFEGASHYLKARDRASYAYALVSCAVTLTVSAGRISRARIALGGVAAKPWRCTAAEALLEGEAPNEDLFLRAGEAALADARPYAMNAYKIRLGRTLIARGLSGASRIEPLQGSPGTVFASSVGGVAGLAAPGAAL